MSHIYEYLCMSKCLLIHSIFPKPKNESQVEKNPRFPIYRFKRGAIKCKVPVVSGDKEMTF